MDDVTINQEANPEGGEVVAFPYTYTLTQSNKTPIGTTWGYNPNTVGTGNQIQINNVQKDGVAVTVTQEIAEEIMVHACRFTDAKPDGYDNFTYATREQLNVRISLVDPSTIFFDFESGADKGVITRFSWHEADGTEAGHWFIFIPW